MRHFIFIILIISLAVQGSLAGYKFCYKTTRLKVADFSLHIPKPEPSKNVPSNGSQQCTPNVIAVLQPAFHYINHSAAPVQVTAAYKNVFISQYISNPPFAPPRPIFIS